MIRKQGHVQFVQTLEDAILLKGELGPIRNGRCGGGESHFAAILHEQFREDSAHVVMIVIVDQHFA